MLQFRVLYQIGEKTARRMLQSGDILGFKTPGGSWRIPDPGPTVVEIMQRKTMPLLEAPFIRGVEARSFLAITDRRLRQLAERGEIAYELHGQRRVYRLRSLLDYMARRGRKPVQRDGYVRPQVMAWARRMLRQTLQEQGMQAPDLLKESPSENANRNSV